MNTVYNERESTWERASPAAVLAIACGVQFVVVLDTLIVNVALPQMKSGLRLSAMSQQWIVTGYLIAFGGLLLLAARVGDLVGHRRMLFGGLAVFGLASAVGGLADEGWMLIAARIAQGAGAAALAPTSLSIITSTLTDPDQRRRALALWGAAAGSAGGVGMVLGGVLTDLLGWRWVLLINLPVALLLASAAVRWLPPARTDSSGTRIDIPGAVTITAAIGSLVFGISQATEHGWLSGRVAGSLVASVVLVGAFALVQNRSRTPLVPASFIARRNVIVANTLMLVVGATMTSTMYFLSVYHQQVVGYSPMRTGLALLPMTVVIVGGAFAAKSLLPIVGARTLLGGGAAVSTAGLLWMATLPPSASYLLHVLGPTVVWAAGISVMTLPIADIATTGVEPGLAGLASGLINTARQLGGAIGLATLGTIAAAMTTHGGAEDLIVGYRTALAVAAGLAAASGVLAFLVPAGSAQNGTSQTRTAPA